MWRDAWAYEDHGKSFEAIFERDHPPGYRYVYETFGTNWRITEIQAAIGRIQLRKLPDWHARRHASGTRIDAARRELPALRVPIVPDHLRHAYDREKAFRDTGLGPAEPLPVARELGETSLCFLCHPTLTDEHVGRAVEVVREVMGRATR